MCRVKTNFTNWTTTVTSSATKILIVHFPLNCQRRTVSCSSRAQVVHILSGSFFQRHSLHLFQILFSGIVTFTPTALDKRLYNSTGEYTVCEETVRWGSSLTIELLATDIDTLSLSGPTAARRARSWQRSVKGSARRCLVVRSLSRRWPVWAGLGTCSPESARAARSPAPRRPPAGFPRGTRAAWGAASWLALEGRPGSKSVLSGATLENREVTRRCPKEIHSDRYQNKTECQLCKRLVGPIIPLYWPGVVWSVKGFHLWMWSLGGIQQPFFVCIWPFSAWWHPNNRTTGWS